MNDYGETMAMRIHGMRNNWYNFYKPRLIAEMNGLPAEVSATWSAIVFQLKLAALGALLAWVTKELEKMEAI